MPHPFDATNKHMFRPYPAEWLAFGGLPSGTKLEFVDTDLSAVSKAADVLVRVLGSQSYIAHFEFQSGYDAQLDRRVLVYNVLAADRLDMEVLSVAVLLRPEALGPGITGRVSQKRGKDHRLNFTYKVVKVWELPFKSLLSGGLGTLPLAPISQVSERQLPGVIETIRHRLGTEVKAEKARELWTATRLMMGLRWSPDLVGKLLRGIHGMKESSTYQEIVQEGMQKGIKKGRADEALAFLLRRGKKVFGAPDAATLRVLKAITDPRQLEALTDRVIDGQASSWASLLNPLA